MVGREKERQELLRRYQRKLANRQAIIQKLLPNLEIQFSVMLKTVTIFDTSEEIASLYTQPDNNSNMIEIVKIEIQIPILICFARLYDSMAGINSFESMLHRQLNAASCGSPNSLYISFSPVISSLIQYSSMDLCIVEKKAFSSFLRSGRNALIFPTYSFEQYFLFIISINRKIYERLPLASHLQLNVAETVSDQSVLPDESVT